MASTTAAKSYSDTKLTQVRGDRGHAELVYAIEYASDDAGAVTAGLVAIDRVAILIKHAGLTGVAEELALAWLREARAALARFASPWGPK